jgi:hypothetical protein
VHWVRASTSKSSTHHGMLPESLTVPQDNVIPASHERVHQRLVGRNPSK